MAELVWIAKNFPEGAGALAYAALEQLDSVVGDHPDPALAAVDLEPALPAFGDELGPAHPVEVDEDDVRLYAVQIAAHAVDLAQAFRQRARVAVVVRQPVDHVVERVEAGSRQ